ncbi:hypothetical protein [Gymnodinialimonas hymeniacidonis]|uniref:hypothetical protein n=1 Tax=Gymnodinialimonas hymeniacidonis TaxID=3126508 RepID=UPI0034C64332
MLRIVWCAWITVILVRQLTLFGTWGDVDPTVWLMIFAWLCVFSFAAIIARSVHPMPNGTQRLTLEPAWQQRWVKRMSLMALLGSIMLIYEFAIVRDYGFSSNVSTVRILEVNRASENSSVSIIGGLGRLMVPALQVAWVLACLSWASTRPQTRALLIAATLVVFWQQLTFEGGRNFWVCLFTMCIIARGAQPDRLRLSRFFKRLLLMAGLLAFLLIIFVNRPEQLGVQLATAYSWQTSHHDVLVPTLVDERFSRAFGSLYFALAMLWLYVTQGIYQLSVIMGDTQLNQAWGMHQFSIAGQILDRVFGLNVSYSNSEELINPGTYPTLIGASIVDFGKGGALVFAGAMGYFGALGLRRLQSGKLSALSLSAPMIATVAVFSPVLSMTPNSWVACALIAMIGLLSRVRIRR